MDTKLKKYRKQICIGSSAVFVVAASAALAAIVSLVMGYRFTSDSGWIVLDGEIAETGDAFVSKVWIIAVIAIAAAIVSFIAAMVTTGQRDEDGRIKFNWFDSIFTDVQLAGGIFAGFGFAGASVICLDICERSVWYRSMYDLLSVPQKKLFDNDFGYHGNGFNPFWVEILLAAVIMVALFALELLIVLSIVKKLKGRCFWKHTIIGAIVLYVADGAKKNESIFWKTMIVLIAGCLISATSIGIVAVLLLIFIFVPKMVKKYQAIKDGVDAVKSGDLGYKIPVTDNGELDRLALSINEISAAASIAVQNELKNQRMKTDLISNVSHDLKTPLTSMVSYVDLLKTEGLDSENAMEYLDIIDAKTKRLQKLTEDLFEAAKASSGAIPVNLERIEMTSIANQALAELEEKLAENGLQVIFEPKAETTFVMADGQLLWRVIENLLTNVGKYALPGSRVYMDIKEKDADMILLEVKNISKDALNISADELMERFKRGDASRNTEGSGLGLAIAKDLTKLMNGEFDITIDGDLFKASVALHTK